MLTKTRVTLTIAWHSIYKVCRRKWKRFCVKYDRVRSTGHVARVGQMRYSCRVLTEKSAPNRQFGRPRHRPAWEDNLKVDQLNVYILRISTKCTEVNVTSQAVSAMTDLTRMLFQCRFKETGSSLHYYSILKFQGIHRFPT